MENITESLKNCLKDERVLAGLTAAVVGLSVKALSQKLRRPPGPPVWPVVGSLLSIENDVMVFKQYAEKYGDIYFLQFGLFGQNPTVVLNNINLVREAFLKKQDDFAGRNRTYTFNLFSEQGAGIILGDFNDMWRYERKIVHTALRKYTSGNRFQDLMERSVEMISDVFRKSDGQPIDIFKPASLIFYNIIATLCFGKNYGMDDPEFNKIRKMMDDLNEKFSGFVLADLLPIFQYIPTPSIHLLKKAIIELFSFVNNYITEHKNNFDENDVRDFTDYIIHIDHEMKASGLAEYQMQLTDKHFRQILLDMFIAGTDSSRLVLTWALMFMAANPEIQEKAQKEIDEQIGKEGTITITSRLKIPYCEAIIYETLRLRPPAPIALPHATTCDTSVGGYDLPKGTQVILNLVQLHNDPREWDNPEEFQPERFLDSHGNLAPKPNAFLPFSAGRRSCVGEAFAKSELHIIFGMLLQRFKFYPPEGKKIDFTSKKNLFAFLPQDNETQLVIKER